MSTPAETPCNAPPGPKLPNNQKRKLALLKTCPGVPAAMTSTIANASVMEKPNM